MTVSLCRNNLLYHHSLLRQYKINALLSTPHLMQPAIPSAFSPSAMCIRVEGLSVDTDWTIYIGECGRGREGSLKQVGFYVCNRFWLKRCARFSSGKSGRQYNQSSGGRGFYTVNKNEPKEKNTSGARSLDHAHRIARQNGSIVSKIRQPKQRHS